MRFELIPKKHPAITWSDNLPDNFTGKRLPGGTVKTAVGNFGSVCIQQYSASRFLFVYEVAQVNEPTSLLYQIDDKKYKKGIHTNLFGQAAIKANEVIINQITDNWMFGLSSPQHIIFDAATCCHRFSLWVSNSFFNSLSQYFDKIKQTQKSDIHSVPCTHADRENIEKILRCPYQLEWLNPYYQYRAGDLLFSFMVSAANYDPISKEYTPTELEQVRNAERIITNDISAHILIPELAKQTGMNEYRFKAVFKMVFAMGPYEYLREKRLQKAIELLDTGEMVKVAAIETGWRVEDLIYAYKSRFGTTPGRRKKR